MSILSTAVTGLLVAQRQLATTSHNIANIDTPGYTRQKVGLAVQTPQTFGNGVTVGKGVLVESISRIYDEFTTTHLRDVTSEQTRLDMFHQLASVVDDLLADSSGGITPTLQNFFSAVQDVADDPNSSAARIAMIDQAAALTARFGYLDERLNALEADLNNRTGEVVNEINGLSRALYETNQDIIASRIDTNIPPPDLLDRRDEIMRNMSELANIQAVILPSGTVNLYVAQGQALVTESGYHDMLTAYNTSDPSRTDVFVQSNGTQINITQSATGGELGGILEFRNTMIDDVRNGLGRIAVGLATVFNQQHRDGIDTNGNLGGDFFSISGPLVTIDTDNVGAATVTSSITDVTALTTDNYNLQYDGANWTLAAVDGSSSVTSAGPTLTLNGFDVTIGGGAATAGDRFSIKPVVRGANSLAVNVTRVEQIAAGSPIRTASAVANTGDGTITSGQILDVTDANLSNPITIRFNTPATTYDLVNTTTGAVLSAGQPYAPGSDIDFNGWRVQISGTPTANDTFTIEGNTSGVGDNSNMLALATLQSTGIFNSNSASFQEVYSEVVADVGSRTRLADINRGTQEALHQTLIDRRESISGVNLDEEAADLLRFQQAYQAAARAISTAQEIFQSLIGAF